MANTTLQPNTGSLALSRFTSRITPLGATLAAVGAAAVLAINVVSITPATGALTATGAAPRMDLAIRPGYGASTPFTLPTTFATPYTTPSGSTIVVGPTDGLQTAITNANPGDIIVVDPANISTPINLPNKGGSSYIYIVSSALASLPEGIRVGAGAPPGGPFPASTAALMPKIIVQGTSPAITCDAGAHHYRFVGFEIATAWADQNATNFGIVQLEAPFPGNQVTADQPHHIIFDRCYIHGTPTGNIRRGILGNGATIAVLDSYISDIHEIGADSQAFAAWNGAGPFRLINNYLEAAGENIMFGGVDPLIANLVPSDIEFRRNNCFKPLTWKVDDASYAGNRWVIKNLFELKNAQRVLVDGNTFDRKWGADGGQLHGIVFTVRNQDGTAPWSIVQDVTFINNVISHVGGGWDVLGTDNNFPSQTSSRILVRNNVWDIDGVAWGGRGDFCQLAGGVDIVVDHNTAFHGNGAGGINNAPIIFTTVSGNLPIGAADQCVRLVFTNNICAYGNFGFFGDLGAGSDNSAFAAYAPGITFRRNAIVAGVSTHLPSDNFYPADLNAVGFLSLANFPDVRLSPSSPFFHGGLDGQDIGWLVDLGAIAPQNQALAFTGQTLGIPGVRTPGTGSLSLTGGPPTLAGTGPVVTPGTGSLATAGQASRYALAAIPTPGSLALTGQPPNVASSVVIITIPTASLTLTGQTPTVLAQQPQLVPGTATLGLTGLTPSVVQSGAVSVVLTPNAGKLSLSRGSPEVTPLTAQLALTGQVPQVPLAGATLITPNTGALFFGDFVGIIPSTGTLSVTGIQARRGTSITTNTGALGLVGQLANPTPSTTVVPSTGTLAMSPVPPIVSIGTVFAPPTAALVFTGNQPSSGIVFQPATGSLTITGVAPTTAFIVMTPGTGSLTMTPTTPALNFSIQPPGAALSLTGQPLIGVGLAAHRRATIPIYLRRLHVLGMR